MTVRPSTDAPADRYLVGSVARAMRVVGMVADSPDGLSLSEIARRVGMSKSAVHALARTLVAGDTCARSSPDPATYLGLSSSGWARPRASRSTWSGCAGRS